MGNSKSTPHNKTGKTVVLQKVENAKKTGILSLSEHKLKSIPNVVFGLHANLRILDLSHNQLALLSSSPSSSSPLDLRLFAKTMKSLNLDYNLLTASSLEHISSLTKLTSLSIGHNRLGMTASQLSEEGSKKKKQLKKKVMKSENDIQFPDFPSNSLKQLKLPHNEFTKIPKSLSSSMFKNLELLDLSGNLLLSLPEDFGTRFPKLIELNLDSNALSKIPDSLGDSCPKLKTLSLRNNGISPDQGIPQSIFVKTQLIDLNLEGNPNLTRGELYKWEGFDEFLERRKKTKSKNLYGGAMTDMSLCGLSE